MGLDHTELSELSERAASDAEGYWSEVAKNLVWTKEWDAVIDDSESPFTKWFVNGELNICYNCLDRHVEAGEGDKTAIIFDSPVTQTRKIYTFTEVLNKVSKLAAVLQKLGVRKGDVVMIYMPMIPEGAFAMFACTRLGALHACMPNGLPAMDLAVRMDHSQPKVIIMASWGHHGSGWKNYKLEVDAAYDRATWKAEKIIVYQRPDQDDVTLVRDRDLDWSEQVDEAEPIGCVPMEANEPLFLVYTSGSTGTPKGIVHAVGSYAVRMYHDTPLFYGSVEHEDVVLATTNFGWVAGHSILLYGPLIRRIPTIVFEGDSLLTEEVRALYRVLSENKVTSVFIRPGIFRLLKAMDPEGTVASEFDLTSLKNIMVGGERGDVKSMEWVTRVFGASVWNAWGQSEMSSVVSGVPDQDQRPIYPVIYQYGAVVPGWNFVIIKPDGTECGPNELGRILARLPLPPGSLRTIFKDEKLFLKNYFVEYPGFYDTNDKGYLNENGQLRMECRVVDIMKVGQVYLSAQAIEEVILKCDAVVECVVAARTDLLWKEIPVALYMKKKDCKQNQEQVSRSLEKMIFEKFGESVKFGGAIEVKELPRTRTGKVHRPSCNAMTKGQKVQSMGFVENPQVFEDIAEALLAADFGRNVLRE